MHFDSNPCRTLRACVGASVLGLSCLLAPAHAQSSDPIAGERQVHLRIGSFDPSVALPALPTILPSSSRSRLWIVQFDGLASAGRRAAIRARGGYIASYLPENAYVVRVDASRRAAIAGLPFVRSMTPYHAAYRVEPALVAVVAGAGDAGVLGPAVAGVDCNLMLVDRRADRHALVAALIGMGANVDPVTSKGTGLLVRARMQPAQIATVAQLDQVLWIDRHQAAEVDMDNARVQGGAAALDSAVSGKYRGQGMIGHVFEAVEAGHKDFKVPATVIGSGTATGGHGHCVAGIIFGQGKGNAAALGLVPEARCYYTDHTAMTAGRGSVLQSALLNEVMFTTVAWGYGRTTDYSSVSAEVDDIVFDTDLVWTQSFSNSGSRLARPEAWGKNVISVGSVAHGDNATASDDSWIRGRASHGPASDGRIKPDLVAYDDSIHCSDLTGGNGYSPTDSFTGFGGTSGATAIVSGYNAIAMQMFADGVFSPKRKATGTVFENRPHASTAKALQIASARQYAFTSTSTDNRREHVGWGFPDVKGMYDARSQHFVVDETDILRQGDGMLYRVNVAQGTSELRIVLAHTDLPANPASLRTRVNDLSLRVKAPSGTRYWGNRGLDQGNASVAGGARDIVDNVECVVIPNPAQGTWEIEVGAWLVAVDGHIETSADDVDFGLVVRGATFQSKSSTSVPVGSFDVQGAGCPEGPGCAVLAARNWTMQSARRTGMATRIAILEWHSFATTVCGVEFFMASRGAARPIKVSLARMDPISALPSQVVTSKVVTVSKLQAYRFEFANPPTFSVSDLYFIILDDADQLELPASPTGEGRYHHAWNGTDWGNALITTPWQYRLIGIGGRKTPQFTGTGDPSIGKNFRFELSDALAKATGVLLIGASDSQWGAIKLPLQYEYPCSLQVSGDFLIPFVADDAGAAVVPISIPNDTRLVRSISYLQFLIAEPQKRSGFIVTNAARLRIGL